MKVKSRDFKDIMTTIIRVHFEDTFNNDPKTILGHFDRMPLAKGNYQDLSRDQQLESYLSPSATHKITCSFTDFDVEKVDYFYIKGELWRIYDCQLLDELYLIYLYSLGKKKVEDEEEEDEGD